ncbi:hypothetical protein, partial [Streptomyces brasiliscabiei]|uniref:hypothetical protein n=1 Tax=Streptomyces brasiliscabiei TaxID=2736302 RepID=UPI0030153C1E
MYAVHGAVDAPHIYLRSVYEYAPVPHSGFEIAFISRKAIIEEHSVLERRVLIKLTEIRFEGGKILIF